MQNQIRKSYHTNIKIAAQLNTLPLEYISKIPKSMLSRFRNTDYSDYFGISIADDITNNIEIR